jgi:hypothetical protein
MNLHSYSHLIFWQGTQNIWWRKDNIFSKCYWKKWLHAYRKLKLYPYLLPCTSTNSKWIKDLNIRTETLQLVQERARNTLEAIGIDENFLSRNPVAKQLKERINKWNCMN